MTTAPEDEPQGPLPCPEAEGARREGNARETGAQRLRRGCPPSPSTGTTPQVGALYQGHYRGSGPPLHQVLSAVGPEGVSVAGSVEGEPSTLRADSSSSAGTAAS